MHIVVRRYRPSDREAVETIYRASIEEHINPAFLYAMTQPLHLTISLAIYIGAYVVGGQSVILSLISGGAWVGLVYFCCHEFYAGYVRDRLRTDMQDIQSYYLDNPENCFWVAEAEQDSGIQILGMVAVETKNDPGGKKHGELLRMIVSSGCRRAGLGKQLAKTVEDFCRERGFTKITLSTSSIQTAAEQLYYRMDFRLVLVNTRSECPQWMIWMTRAKILYMEKILS